MIPQRIPLLGLEAFSPSEVERLRARAAGLFGRMGARLGAADGVRLYSSPGRTELGGNHTDHNSGCVLAASVDLDMLAAARPRGDRLVTLASPGYPPLSVDCADLAPKSGERGSPASLVRGLAAWIANRGLPPCAGFDIAVDSEVPAGSGLSSSAAFELLVAAIFDDMGGYGLSPAEWAQAGKFAENAYFGKPSGLMDQLACALGGISYIDFQHPDAPRIENLAFDFSSRGIALATVATDSDHGDLTAEYAAIPEEMRSVAARFGLQSLRGLGAEDLLCKIAEIRSTCGDRAFLRAWHFVHETARPERMSRALAAGDIGAYLTLVRESGRSSWTLLQNIHAPDPRRQSLDIALALAEEWLGPSGARAACRVHGGGFAGTIQVYVPETEFGGFARRMETVFGPGCVRKLNLRPFGVCRILIDSPQK